MKFTVTVIGPKGTGDRAKFTRVVVVEATNRAEAAQLAVAK